MSETGKITKGRPPCEFCNEGMPVRCCWLGGKHGCADAKYVHCKCCREKYGIANTPCLDKAHPLVI